MRRNIGCRISRVALPLLAIAWAAPTAAQSAQPNAAPPERCREGAGAATDIVVCGQRNENERYRIPKQLRRSATASERSSSARLAAEVPAGVPNAASNVGAAGMSGHNQQAIDAWYDKRKKNREGR